MPYVLFWQEDAPNTCRMPEWMMKTETQTDTTCENQKRNVS